MLNKNRTHVHNQSLTSQFHSLSVIHSYAVKVTFFFSKALRTTNKQRMKTSSTYSMLRDRSGHSSTCLSDRVVQPGRDPGGFRWSPGWLSWSLCLTTTQRCCESIQPDVAPSSSQHRLVAPNVILSTNLIQHQRDLYMIMYKIYTKKCAK